MWVSLLHNHNFDFLFSPMSLDKNTLDYVTKKIDLYVNSWDEKYKCFIIEKDIPDIWNVIIVTTENKYIVSDADMKYHNLKLKEISRCELINIFKNYEDNNYKIFYKQMDQHLVGYLLDFFIYYVELPDKIQVESDENIDLFLKIKNLTK